MSFSSFPLATALRRRWLRASLHAKGLLAVGIPMLPLVLLDTSFVLTTSGEGKVDTTVVLLIALVCMGGGAFATILLTRGVVSRVAEVKRDAGRLEAREPLPPANADELDEIGALRSKLRAAADLLHMREQQLEEATRSRNEFLSRMSHDLRTPLNAIIGFAQLLKTDRLNRQQHESVVQILNGSRHLLQLIDEVLHITRADTGKIPLSLEPLNVSDVVDHVIALIRPLIEPRGLDVSSSVDPNDWVMADRARLSEILLNLLSNAVKYNRVNGSIAIGSRRHRERVHIMVCDTGPGLSTDKLARLFVPFERLGAEHGPEEGTGLGLALSKKLAMAMDGDLLAESTPGVGSTFSIDLPHAAPVAVPVKDCEVPEAQTLRALWGRVLYIDDTPSNLLLVQRVLQKRAGVEVLTAGCGEEGILLARTAHPRLILLDLHLPDMHGVEVLRQLRAHDATKDIPVVILSADATASSIERLLGLGAVGYIPKPLDIHKMLRVVDEYCQVA